MPTPTYDQMMRPLLAHATREDLTRQRAEAVVAAHFNLSADALAQRIPSGADGLVRNRAGWAMTYLSKAGLLAKVAPKTYRATEAATAFLVSHPEAITARDLRVFGDFQTFQMGYTGARPTPEAEPEVASDAAETQTPLELLDATVAALRAEVGERLLQAILAQTPAFFERLVLDVLTALGYGGRRGGAAFHTGQSGDEGIDGRIDQDPLGLDQILVQAKRYAPGHAVPRKDIQAFVGSLAGPGVTRGVFITTSHFAASAHEFVQRGSQTKIVLLDGPALVDLMLRHKVGVRVERSVDVLDLDHNYFSVD